MGVHGGVLDVAFRSEAFRTDDAMAETGLTRSTVIAQCDALVESGWLESLENAREAGHGYRGGRPSRRFRLRADAARVIGIDAGEHSLTAILADAHGTALRRHHVALDSAAAGPEERVRAIEDALDRLADGAAGTTDTEVPACVVVGVPAPVDAAGSSRAPGNPFWSRMNPALAERLSGRGQVVLIENDATLAGIAEAASGAARNFSSSVTLLSGERFGAGLIVDGAPVRGAHGAAGELHVLDLVDGVGGSYGLSPVARALVTDALDAGRIPPDSALRGLREETELVEALFLAASDGDATALGIIEALAVRVARIAALLAGILDVEAIVVAGGIAGALDDLLPRARAHLAELAFRPLPHLLASPLGADVVAIGAIARAREHLRQHIAGTEARSR